MLSEMVGNGRDLGFTNGADMGRRVNDRVVFMGKLMRPWGKRWPVDTGVRSSRKRNLAKLGPTELFYRGR